MPTSDRSDCSKYQEKKICESCGRVFSCGAMGPGCWCEEVHLTTAAREEIADKYHECLCRECLAGYTTKVGK